MALRLLDPILEYTVYRAGTGQYLDGVYVPLSDPSDPMYIAIKIKANIQADLSAKEQDKTDRQFLFNDHDGEIKIFTKPNTPLFSQISNPLHKADIINYENKLYEVKETASWTNPAFTNNVRHFKTRAKRIKDKAIVSLPAVDPFLPVTTLQRKDITILQDIPANTIITIDTDTVNWSQTGDNINLGVNSNAFNNNKGLEIRLNDLEVSKGFDCGNGRAAFWVAPNQLYIARALNATEIIIIKEFVTT